MKRLGQVSYEEVYNYSFVGILCLGLAVRLMGLNKSIWLDEYTSLRMILQGNIFETFRALRLDIHPPLYFVLVDLWSQLSVDEIFLRLLSVVFGTGTVLILMKWMEQYSRLAAAMSGLYCATVPIMIRYSQEIRHYGLFVLATALSFFFASRLLCEPEESTGYVGLSLSLTVAVTTHLLGSLIIGAVCAFLAASAVSSFIYRRIKVWKLVLAVASPSLVFLLIYWFYLPHTDENLRNWWVPPVSVDLISGTGKYVLGLKTIFWPLDVVLSNIPVLAVPVDFSIKFLLLVGGAILVFGGDWRRTVPFAVSAVIYWVQLVAYSMLGSPIFMYRTVLPGLVPLMGFMGLQIATVRRRILRVITVTGLVLVSLVFMGSWVIEEAWQPVEKWKQVSQLLESSWTRHSFVVFYPEYVRGPVHYYFAGIPAEAEETVPLRADVALLEEKVGNRITAKKEIGSSVIAFLVVRSDLSVERNLQTYDRLLRFLETRLGSPVLSQHFGTLGFFKYRLQNGDT